MKSFIRKKLPFIMIAIQAALILGLLFYIVPGRYRLYDIVLYDASENVPPNPMIGYAPDALVPEDCAGTDLVFLKIPFSEWEPEEGVFDTEGIEEKYHVDEYRGAGKHAVLRFVCDVPAADRTRDLPSWLRDKVGDGTKYEDAGGKGYAPDYENETLIEAHREALNALADWCRRDSFVSYVEIGSVGQNGIWYAHAENVPAPSAATLEKYADQYRAAFPEESGIRLLFCAGTARPEGEETSSAGTWKDVLGDAGAAEEWRMEDIGLPADPREENEEDPGALWTRGPVGGSLSPDIPMEELLMDRLSDTLEQVRSCHVSFIGPNCPDAGRQQSNGSEMILRDVGYCVYLSRLQTTVDYIDDDLVLHFTFANIGQAPLYWDWPVTMYIYDRDGECIREEQLDLKMSELLPDTEITVNGTVPYSRDLLQGYSVGLAVRSPDGTDKIKFAQKGVLPDAEGIHMIYRFKPSR